MVPERILASVVPTHRRASDQARTTRSNHAPDPARNESLYRHGVAVEYGSPQRAKGQPSSLELVEFSEQDKQHAREPAEQGLPVADSRLVSHSPECPSLGTRTRPGSHQTTRPPASMHPNAAEPAKDRPPPPSRAAFPAPNRDAARWFPPFFRTLETDRPMPPKALKAGPVTACQQWVVIRGASRKV